MRSVALFIILLNLLVFAWYQHFLPWLPWQPPEKIAYQPVPETKEIPKLILLSEKNSSADVFDDTATEDVFNEINDSVINEPKFELVTAEPETPTTDIVANTTTVTTVDSDKASVDPQPIADIAYTLGELGRIAEQEVKKTSTQLAQRLHQHTDAHFLVDEGFSLKPTESIASLEPELDSSVMQHANEVDKASPQINTVSGLSLAEKTTHVPSFEPFSSNNNIKEKEISRVATLSTAATKTVDLKNTLSTQANKQAINTKKREDKAEQTKPVLTKKTQTNAISPPQPHFICYTTGIYQDKSLAQRVTTWFKAKPPTIARMNTQTSRKLVSTWVYLPPLKNRAEARRKEYELDNLGITTHHIIAKGMYQNALSLGRFKNQKNVTNFLHWLKSRGLNGVKTKSNYLKKETYTVHIKLEKMASQHIIKTFKRHFKHQINRYSHCK